MPGSPADPPIPGSIAAVLLLCYFVEETIGTLYIVTWKLGEGMKRSDVYPSPQ